MKKYPFVKQEGMKECGIASLLMVIKYYKGYISMQELASMTKTNKDGTTLYHLVKVLTEIGFDADGVSCPFDELLKNKIPMPCICSVLIDNSYKHFIVLYEITKKWFIVADPSVGIKKLSYKEFKEIYQNNLIICVPNQTIPIVSEEKYYNITKIIIKNIKIIKLIIIYSVFITTFSIINSFYFGKLLENTNSLKNTLLLIFFIFFSMSFIKIVMDYIRNKLFLYLNKKIDLELTKEIFSKILSLPYKHYKNHTTGDIISRINDMSNLKELLERLLISIFIDIPLAFFSALLLLKLNIKLFIISFIILLLNLLLILLFKKITYFAIVKLKRLKSLTISKMIEAINGFETIKGISIKHFIERKVLKNHVDYLNHQCSFSKIIIIKNLLKNLINDLGILIIDYIGITFVFDGKITLSLLVTFNTALNYCCTSISNIMDFVVDYNEYKSSFKRINEIMIENKDNGFLTQFTNGNIEFLNVNYSFNDIDCVLKNINLKILQGERLIVIGKSGSGKSTLFKLLKRYYEVDFDKITINEIDINNYVNKILDENILYVNQHEIIFNDTILNNIKLENKVDDKFLDICKICEIKPIVVKNKLGFNYFLEENGFNLSGGERQRIILARSLLKNFNILIIDEALNQVDILMERRILKNLFNYFKDKTIIFISHRLNNCDLFNHIIEMKEGKIIKDETRLL